MDPQAKFLLAGTNIVALEPDCVARGCGKLGVLLAPLGGK